MEQLSPTVNSVCLNNSLDKNVPDDDDDVYATLPITGSCNNVMIHSILDEEIDRPSYDADLYDGQDDGVSIHLRNDPFTPPKINSLSTNEIQKIIDDITYRDTTIQSFTNADLNAHISSQCTFKIQVGSGASDCITLDKHILKQHRTVKPRSITTAKQGSKSCVIVGVGYLNVQTTAGDWLSVKTFHIPKAVGTILLPTFMALDNKNFSSWGQITHILILKKPNLFFTIAMNIGRMPNFITIIITNVGLFIKDIWKHYKEFMDTSLINLHLRISLRVLQSTVPIR